MVLYRVSSMIRAYAPVAPSARNRQLKEPAGVVRSLLSPRTLRVFTRLLGILDEKIVESDPSVFRRVARHLAEKPVDYLIRQVYGLGEAERPTALLWRRHVPIRISNTLRMRLPAPRPQR